MSRILGLLFALVLVFGIALAYDYTGDDFDAATGTGTLGVGSIVPPGQDTPPDTLTAERTKTVYVTWQCSAIPDSPAQPQFGSYTQTQTAEADVKLNPKDMVLNYTFNGWSDGGKVFTGASHNQSTANYAGFAATFAPGCLNAERVVENVNEDVSYSGVSFY